MGSSPTVRERMISRSSSNEDDPMQCPDGQKRYRSDKSSTDENDSEINEKEDDLFTEDDIEDEHNPLQKSTSGEILRKDMDEVDRSRSRKHQNQNQRKNSKQNMKTEDSSMKNLYTIILSVFVPLFLLYFYGGTEEHCDNTNIKTSIQEIALKYPLQNNDVWDYLQTGIQRLINEEKEPMVFFLVQWSDKSETAFNIAMAAGAVTARNLSCSSPSKPIILTPNLINTLERGELIDLYRKQLEEEHVLVIKDIEKVSPIVAQDFRYFCDEENPVVGKAVIFFIMNMNNCTGVTLSDVYGGPMRDTITAVEKCLTEFWGAEDGLDSTVLFPVLSRVVNVVLPIRDVKKKL